MKQKILLLICFMMSIVASYAEIPNVVTTTPHRYMFVSLGNNEHLLKVDTQIGKVWYVVSKKDAAKSNLKPFKNLPDVDESNSYEGRFVFETTFTGGGDTVYFMMDSQTGKVWQLDMYRCEANEIFESSN